MRSGVEAGGLQLTPHLGEDRRGVGGNWSAAPREHPIDVVHAKADTLHVEGGDGTGERLALLDERQERRALRLRAENRDELLDSGLRGLAMIGGLHGWMPGNGRLTERIQRGRGRQPMPYRFVPAVSRLTSLLKLLC